MDDMLQPFPAKFASPTGDANLFVARSGEMVQRDTDHMHRHDFYEFVWLNEGNCLFFSDFQRYPLSPGTLIFISPGQLHTYLVPEGHCRITIFGFRPTVLTSIAPDFLAVLPFDNTRHDPVLVVTAKQFGAFEHLFSTALRRFDARVSGWEQTATTYLQTALTEAAYLMPQTITEVAPDAATQLKRAFQRSMEQHYIELQQVAAYAGMLGVTTNHLVKTVRETTGETPKQLLQKRLLLESKRLLIHSNATINEISYLLQFKDPTTFSRWFRRLTELTPTQFRSDSPLA